MIPPGVCRVGTYQPQHAEDGEGPERNVRLKGFLIDKFAVTNARFDHFVSATGYRTDAERFGWSYVFVGMLADPRRWPADKGAPDWWRPVQGAFWKSPEGDDSTNEGRGDHPVVHISWTDAVAFATWVGGRLPTEAEWEFAAKGGLASARFPWGDEDPDDTFTPCNIWQGEFPARNTGNDGFMGTAPVDSFAPNSFGLFNMVGNAWEWCADAFSVRSLSRAAKKRNGEARRQGDRVLKGGSYLCHRSYCYRYRIAARTGRSSDTSAAHTGFRVAYDAADLPLSA